jgi:hypothetical protein
MKLGRKKVRNDPELCRMVSEIVGETEDARRGLEDMLGKDLTQQILGNKGRPKRVRKVACRRRAGVRSESQRHRTPKTSPWKAACDGGGLRRGH